MASALEGEVAPARDDVARAGARATDLMLIGMALIWGVNFSVAKYGARAFAPLAFNGLRVALAGAALLVLALAARGAWPTRRDALSLLGLGLLGNCAYQICFIQGVSRTRAGTAALVLAASPALSALIGRALRVERVGRRGWLGIALQLLGVACVVLGTVNAPAGEGSLGGDLLLFVGAVCWATFSVGLKPFARRAEPLQVAALTMVGGAVPLLLVAAPALAATSWSAVGASAWGAVAYSGLGALVVAYLFWSRGVRVLGPTRTAMYGNLQPIIALLVAWLALGEVPTVWQGLGVTTIMSGLLLGRL